MYVEAHFFIRIYLFIYLLCNGKDKLKESLSSSPSCKITYCVWTHCVWSVANSVSSSTLLLFTRNVDLHSKIFVKMLIWELLFFFFNRYVFAAIYTLEMFLKIIGRGFALHKYAYLRNAWNWLDFLVVILG